MTKEQANKLPHGVYRIYWKPYSYYSGFTLAAIGSLKNGDRWVAPVNWVSLTGGFDWDQVQKVELIEAVNYGQKQEKEDLTPTGTYRVQIYEGKIAIATPRGYVYFDMPKLIESLRECGYQITEPLSKSFIEIRRWLETLELKKTESLGDTIYTFWHATRKRTITVTAVGSKIEVNIESNGKSVFVGHVLSLDEFKLIWDRIL